MESVQTVLGASLAKDAAYAAITMQLERLHENRAFGADERQQDAHTTAALVQALAQLLVLDAPCCEADESESTP